MAVNVILSFVKFFVGIFSSSQALVADAFHSLSDTSTDIAVLIGVHYWSAPPDTKHPHGHGRIEALITLFIALVLASVGVGLVYRAIVTVHRQDIVSPGWLAFWVACMSIVAKEILYRWTASTGNRIQSSAVIANAWHHRSDALSSLPVAVAILGTHIHPSWIFLDHIAAVIVSVFILQASWKIARPAISQLIDSGANEKDRQVLTELAKATEAVIDIHALRTRQIGSALQIDLHILVDSELTVRQGHQIAATVKYRLLNSDYNVSDVVVHVEPYKGC